MEAAKIEILFQQIDDLDTLLSSMKDNLSSGLKLHIYGKYIIEEDGFIYRIYGWREGLEKLGLIKYFEEQGVHILLPEKQIATKTKEIIFTKQKKITPISLKGDQECLSILKNQLSQKEYEHMIEIFQKIGFMWYGGNRNCGKDEDGKIKIFDWIANISVTKRRGKPQIINSKGEILTNVYD